MFSQRVNIACFLLHSTVPGTLPLICTMSHVDEIFHTHALNASKSGAIRLSWIFVSYDAFEELCSRYLNGFAYEALCKRPRCMSVTGDSGTESSVQGILDEPKETLRTTLTGHRQQELCPSVPF